MDGYVRGILRQKVRSKKNVSHELLYRVDISIHILLLDMCGSYGNNNINSNAIMVYKEDKRWERKVI